MTTTNFCLYQEEDTGVSGLKRNNEAQIPSLGMHVLPTHDSLLACNGEISLNYLYEIDHSKLPPKSPIQLKSIRAVMVTEKTDYSVSVRFPSTLSLRKYFSKRMTRSDMCPDLDELFVIRSSLASGFLVRKVIPQEFVKQKHLESFWLVDPKAIDKSSSEMGSEDENWEEGEEGMCLSSALKRDGFTTWGCRRRTEFIGRQTDRSVAVVPSSSCLMKHETEGEQGGRISRIKAKKEKKKKHKKRKCEKLCKNKIVTVAKCQEMKPLVVKVNSQSVISKQKVKKLSYDRWSKERYEGAEVKMLEVMKELGAVYGRPVLRQALRNEARKHIGDTGLLDHLLKHMAGKEAPNGIDRFRRRHNAEGAMEYWLENTDLINVRRNAGVTDPYWTPPPGWEPGDNPSQDPVCAKEIKHLKDEMAILKRNVEELMQLKGVDKDAGAMVISTKCSSTCIDLESVPPEVTVEGVYENLVKKKTQLEEQLAEISNSLKDMQGEIGKVASTVEGGTRSAEVVAEEVEESDKTKKAEKGDKDEEEGGAISTAPAATATEAEAEAAAAGAGADKQTEEQEEKAAKRQRLRSGFRICKPQGTFLWPNMGVSAGSSNMLSPKVGVEDPMFVVPTPPSAKSTATSPPPHPLFVLPAPPPLGPTSPVKPLPKKRPISIPLPSACEGDNILYGTPFHPNTHHHLHQGFCGTSSSSSAPASYYQHQHPFVLPPAVARVTDDEARSFVLSNHARVRTYQRKQQQQQMVSRDTYSVGSWLALATPNHDC